MSRILKQLVIALSITTLFMGAAQADGHAKHSSMSMHHMHIMINHALEMATEGSNMIMLGKMDMAKGVDEITVKHGQMMISHAKELIKDVMEGDAMHALHHGGSTPEGDAAMAYTHKLADTASEYIKLLEGMGSSSMAAGAHKH